MRKISCAECIAPLAAAFIAIAPAMSASQPHGRELNPACLTPGKPVNETGYVTVGGIRQWVTVEGQDCANPVVLIVHGGPGNPNTPFAHNLFGSWTKEFTIVQWDQRGSGKTYAESKPDAGEVLTMERLVKDEAAYEAGEDYSFLNFVGVAGDGMGPKIDLRKLGVRFAMPVYMLQGDEDLVTPPEVSRAYFDELVAPKKEFLALSRTGHDPNRTMIDAQYGVLQRVRAEALERDKR